MNNLFTKIEQSPKEDYNKIPVHYCKECLSLAVMRVARMDDACYCDTCGSTDIEQTSIEEWEELYKKRYGFRYLDNTL